MVQLVFRDMLRLIHPEKTNKNIAVYNRGCPAKRVKRELTVMWTQNYAEMSKELEAKTGLPLGERLRNRMMWIHKLFAN